MTASSDSPASGSGALDDVELDVRPILAVGDEPFDLIMETVASLAPGQALVLRAPFEPVPLEGVLSSQGFEYEVTELGADDWRVVFRSPA